MGESYMSIPNIGQTIRMELKSEDEEKSKLTYKTRVADVHDDFLTLELPLLEKSGRPLYSSLGTEFLVTYMDSNNNTYHFHSKLLGRKEENIPLIMISLPPVQEIIKSQKRGFFRVEANLDIAVRLIDQERNYHIVTKTIDIGGGGISFQTPLEHPFHEGDLVKMWCVLAIKDKEISRVILDGEIVRIHPLEVNDKLQIISIRFVNLKDRENQLILRYCFNRQIKERHRFGS